MKIHHMNPTSCAFWGQFLIIAAVNVIHPQSFFASSESDHVKPPAKEWAVLWEVVMCPARANDGDSVKFAQTFDLDCQTDSVTETSPLHLLGTANDAAQDWPAVNTYADLDVGQTCLLKFSSQQLNRLRHCYCSCASLLVMVINSFARVPEAKHSISVDLSHDALEGLHQPDRNCQVAEQKLEHINMWQRLSDPSEPTNVGKQHGNDSLVDIHAWLDCTPYDALCNKTRYKARKQGTAGLHLASHIPYLANFLETRKLPREFVIVKSLASQRRIQTADGLPQWEAHAELEEQASNCCCRETDCG
mmetsp:Transcript_105274/g.296397  ORF Transcript_105274/g.296397 Transcript_105274/m.296397 type:complete len:304 (+) Transcript_105274:308-1219(+)